MNLGEMKIGDIMTTDVVTISGNSSLSEARRLMDLNHLRRLPVVDNDKLIGIITKDGLDRMGPSQLTTFSIHELSYLLSKIKVLEVMRKDVLTGTPDMTVKEAVAMGQSKRVGSIVVVEAGKVVGIVTTNDIFYKLLNPLLGLEPPGI